jgi:hypothetical protein
MKDLDNLANRVRKDISSIRADYVKEVDKAVILGMRLTDVVDDDITVEAVTSIAKIKPGVLEAAIYLFTHRKIAKKRFNKFWQESELTDLFFPNTEFWIQYADYLKERVVGEIA